jgi:hypothetical protein
MPRSGFIPEFETYSTMLPRMLRMPKGIALPAAAEPGIPAPAGQSTVPAAAPNGLPAPVRVRGNRMFPPHLIMALGIIPAARGVRSNISPDAFVAAGRKPGL